eukprot:m.180608 g.180608  ORF g.180608 m.180608 type:complete len:70 (+) comp16858_c1_seq2:488-697(+)
MLDKVDGSSPTIAAAMTAASGPATSSLAAIVSLDGLSAFACFGISHSQRYSVGSNTEAPIYDLGNLPST